MSQIFVLDREHALTNDLNKRIRDRCSISTLKVFLFDNVFRRVRLPYLFYGRKIKCYQRTTDDKARTTDDSSPFRAIVKYGLVK